jgi:hypothetical protein
MEHNYTENQIIRFLYNEVDVFEHFEIQDAIEHDLRTRNTYQRFRASFEQLNLLRQNPSASSIQNILGYSKSTSISLA